MDGFLPPPSLTKRNSGFLSPKLATASSYKEQYQSPLSAVQKGLLLAKQQGDLDALQFAFPVTIREHLPPGVDPNHPGGIYEATHEPFPFKALKELKQAVQNWY